MRDDKALIDGCRGGDAGAWAELVQRYQRLVYSIPRRLGLSAADCDDVFQVVFGIVLRRLDTLRDESRVSAWLIRTTYREAWRVARSRRTGQPELSHTVPDTEAPSAEQAERWEQQHLVRTAVAQLDERCRKLLEALYFERQTPEYAEIAARLGLAVGSIGPTRARCFQKLEALLHQLGL